MFKVGDTIKIKEQNLECFPLGLRNRSLSFKITEIQPNNFGMGCSYRVIPFKNGKPVVINSHIFGGSLYGDHYELAKVKKKVGPNHPYTSIFMDKMPRKKRKKREAKVKQKEVEVGTLDEMDDYLFNKNGNKKITQKIYPDKKPTTLDDLCKYLETINNKIEDFPW